MVHILIHKHDRGLVAAAVAIVGRREDGDTEVGVCPLETLHNKLVRADDKVEAIVVIELLGDIWAKGVSSAAGRDAPAHVVVRIGPYQVADWALVGHFLLPRKALQLVHGVDRRRETSMGAENLARDGCSEREVVEDLHEFEPDLGRPKFAEAFVVEAIHLSDLPRLVVAAEKAHPRGEAGLEEHHQSCTLHRVVPAVHIVAQENKVCVRRIPCDAEKLQEVIKLAVDISHDGHRCGHRVHVLFFRQDFLGLGAEHPDLLLRQVLPALQAFNLSIKFRVGEDGAAPGV
mmetsp:Transcript_12300/g.35562  ORF Transcript_12300/g.35562 Transcript_12300/m.35562 type:complete len:288 (+) Transcript_12300:192-1055(+)